jgi:transposase
MQRSQTPQHNSLAPKRRTYTSRVKNEAVRRVLTSGESQADVARDLDVHPGAVRAWVWQQRHMQNRPTANVPADAARVTDLEQENRALRAENEFLKKARAFFAATSRPAT